MTQSPVLVKIYNSFELCLIFPICNTCVSASKYGLLYTHRTITYIIKANNVIKFFVTKLKYKRYN